MVLYYGIKRHANLEFIIAKMGNHDVSSFLSYATDFALKSDIYKKHAIENSDILPKNHPFDPLGHFVIFRAQNELTRPWHWMG